MKQPAWITPNAEEQKQKQNKSDQQNYNVKQSKIAIGSGGFFGKGFLKGTQTRGDFVPEQHTDFIFTSVGENFGFLGSGLLMFHLPAVICLRIIKHCRTATKYVQPGVCLFSGQHHVLSCRCKYLCNHWPCTGNWYYATVNELWWFFTAYIYDAYFYIDKA